VLLRYALAHSMNIPSLKVLDTIGFDAAITRASRMLGFDDPAEIEAVFPRKYPLGLGVVTVSPLQMARAFATFPNQGRTVEPLAIRYVEDRNGRIILEPEKELLTRQKRAGQSLEIMSPQTAYLMTDLLQSTVKSGTLNYANTYFGKFERPVAGKTGTTQNWSDAWTVGFTPQMTTAVWFGFDERGYSLGINLTGATSAGPAWAEYMRQAHENLPVMEFTRPQSGLIEVEVCAVSGRLPTRYCTEGTVTELFLTGTEPREFCDYHKYEAERTEEIKDNIKNSLLFGDFQSVDIQPPELGSTPFNPLAIEPIPESQSQELINPLLD
jgi:penicillin-binding protein 1A